MCKRSFALRGLAILFSALLAACASTPGTSGTPGTPGTPSASDQPASPILIQFRARIAQSRREVPFISQSADAAAARIAANPRAMIEVPYARQDAFAEEILNRAGGLANALPPEERPNVVTPDDVLLISARCWVLDANKVRSMVTEGHDHHWLIVLFASQRGMPADIKVDYLIDNGAASPGQQEAGLNVAANAMNAWLWICEYTAALSRYGRYPGILLTILRPDSKDFDAKLQSHEPYPHGRWTMYDADQPIAARDLAHQYLHRVDQLMDALASPEIQKPLEHSADLIVKTIQSGHSVYVSSCTHLLMSEVMPHAGEPPRTPMKGIQAVYAGKNAFTRHIQPGDLIVWVGYVGMSTQYEDYGQWIAATAAPVISICVTDKTNPGNNGSYIVEHVEQSWQPPDAEIKIPFPPGVMAPVSGIDQALLYRMLEDGVARKLAAAH